MRVTRDRCSPAEYERRYAAVRAAMREQGLECLLVYGNAQGWQNVFYLSNHWDLVSCWLVVPLENEPMLITGVYPHLPAVRAVSVVADIRFGGRKSIEAIAKLFSDRRLSDSRVGLVEADSYRMPGIPHRDMLELQAALPRARFENATALLETIRRTKSREEIELLRQCAALTDDAFDRAVAAVRSGTTEHELASVIAGSPGDTVAVLVGSTAMDRPDVPNPSIRPTSRVLQQGDIVMFELSKGMAGYAGQLHGMVSLGAPLERFVEAHAVALDAYDAIRGVLCAGCTGAQVADAASSIRQRGFNIGNPLTHGFGLGIESGLHVGLLGHPAYWPPTGVVFPEGASLTIEPNPCNADMSFGATAGAMVIVEGQSCTEIHARVSREIIRA